MSKNKSNMKVDEAELVEPYEELKSELLAMAEE